MFANWVGPLFMSALLPSTCSSAARVDASRSCTELVALREETDAAAARLAGWMEQHCPGTLEDTDPFCRFQSRSLLERLAELSEVKAALEARRCELREVRDAGAEGPASLIHLAATPPIPVDRPPTIGSFEDNWPWPRRPTFQAGLAASAGFRIRKCRANPDCEW
jgi:hypothetical protein